MIAGPLSNVDETTDLDSSTDPPAPSQGQFLFDGGTSDSHKAAVNMTAAKS